MHGLLIAVAIPAVKRGLQGAQASVVGAHGGSVALWHVGSSQPGIEPWTTALTGRFLTTGPPGESLPLSID